jgi:hypothetical protein
MGTLIDYAEFLLDIRKNLKDFEECMLDRKFKEAQLYAESALVDARLLCLIAKEKVK